MACKQAAQTQDKVSSGQSQASGNKLHTRTAGPERARGTGMTPCRARASLGSEPAICMCAPCARSLSEAVKCSQSVAQNLLSASICEVLTVARLCVCKMCIAQPSPNPRPASGVADAVTVQRLSEADKCARQVLWRRKILPDDCFEEMRFARQSMHKIKASRRD
jgi:hypothetical protein